MIHRLVIYFALTVFVVKSSWAQDTLLLNNGKYKNLKGTVVFFDYNDVLYQTDAQKAKMETKLAQLKVKQEAKRSSESWKLKQAAIAEKATQKRERKRLKLKERKADFSKQLEKRKNNLSDPVAFERWKSRQETDLKLMEKQIELDSILLVESLENEFEIKQARVKNRYTKRISRQLVFSILRADGSEQVVYNADTLGLLADGEYEKEYGVEEMRLYIKGRQDGRKHSFHDVYIGAATGLASGLLFTYFLDMFYAPIPVAGGIVALAVRNNFKPNPKLELTQALLESDPYMDGYIKSAKGRKIFAFTVGAIGGLGVGIGVAVATSPLLQ